MRKQRAADEAARAARDAPAEYWSKADESKFLSPYLPTDGQSTVSGDDADDVEAAQASATVSGERTLSTIVEQRYGVVILSTHKRQMTPVKQKRCARSRRAADAGSLASPQRRLWPLAVGAGDDQSQRRRRVARRLGDVAVAFDVVGRLVADDDGRRRGAAPSERRQAQHGRDGESAPLERVRRRDVAVAFFADIS